MNTKISVEEVDFKLNVVYCKAIYLIEKQVEYEIKGHMDRLLNLLNNTIDDLMRMRQFIDFKEVIVLYNSKDLKTLKGRNDTKCYYYYDVQDLRIDNDLDDTYDDNFINEVKNNMDDLEECANQGKNVDSKYINDSLFTYLSCLRKIKKYDHVKYYRAACIIRTVLRVAMPKYL